MTKKTWIFYATMFALLTTTGYIFNKYSADRTNLSPDEIIANSNTDKECRPLLIFIEGGGVLFDGDTLEKTENFVRNNEAFFHIKNLDIEYIENVNLMEPVFKPVNGYFFKTHFNEEKIQQKITRYSKDRWPIVVVGWSLGGTSAWSMSKYRQISLLVTLDPVSAGGKYEKFTSNKADHWINVYSTEKTFLAWAPWRWIFGQWGKQEEAENIPSSAQHGEVHLMYTLVESTIIETLESCS